jgi:hypothetical protein
MKTGKITGITPNGSWSNGSKTFNRYNVSMADGNIYQFNAIGNFKHQVGDECTFTSEQKEYNGNIYNTAKLVKLDNFQPTKPQGNFQKKPDDVQKFIIRQSSVASAVNFYKDTKASEEEVLSFAEKIVQYIYS